MHDDYGVIVELWELYFWTLKLKFGGCEIWTKKFEVPWAFILFWMITLGSQFVSKQFIVLLLLKLGWILIVLESYPFKLSTSTFIFIFKGEWWLKLNLFGRGKTQGTLCSFPPKVPLVVLVINSKLPLSRKAFLCLRDYLFILLSFYFKISAIHYLLLVF